MTKELDHYASIYEEEKTFINTRKERLAVIENRIIDLIGCKKEGSTTHKTLCYKITSTGKINRKLEQNLQAIANLEAVLGTELFFKLIRVEYKLIEKTLKTLAEFDREAFNAIVPLVTETPDKPSIKIQQL